MHRNKLWLAGCALLASCLDPQAKLLESDPHSEARRRRMDLVVQVNNAGTWSVDGTVTSPGSLVPLVEDHCAFVLSSTPAYRACFPAAGYGTPEKCEEASCDAQMSICVANTLREMAGGTREVLLALAADAPPLIAGDPGYRVQGQDPETLVALWQATQIQAARALSYISVGLLDECPGANQRLSVAFSTASGELEQTNGELLAAALAEALGIGELAAENGSRAALGLAERDRASIADLGDAARLSWFDENLSRLIAVQAHIGGLDQSLSMDSQLRAGSYVPDDHGEYYRSGSAAAGVGIEDGIGLQPGCQDACATALETIRLSGAPFDQVIGTTSLEMLVTSYIGPRLAARAPGVYDTTSADALAASVRVPRAAFVEARAWLRHEAEILARPTGQIAPTPPLPPLLDGTPGTTSLTFDATTMARATPPPPMHYFTAARKAQFWTGFQSIVAAAGQSGSLRLPTLTPARADMFGFANALAREAITDSDMPAEARGFLATITQMGAARRALEIEACIHPDTSYGNHLRLRISGLSSAPEAGDFLLVKGTTAMRCAVDGVVEGVSCTAAFDMGVAAGFIPPDQLWAEVTSSSRASRLRVVQWDYSLMGTMVDPYLYVLRRRPDRAGGAGGYEPIAGIPSPVPALLGAGDCTTVTYDFLSSELGASTFAMGPDLLPENGCGDINLSGRVPLEDEIIDDGDPYEDSWQHHLRVAAAAAAHADELGQQLIAAGLTMDERAERSLETLQTLCDVPINIDPLFGTDGSLQDLVLPEACDEATSLACPASYECVGKQCVLRGVLPAEESYDRAAILECLGLDETGSSALVPVVAFGATPLCVWRDSDNPEFLCPGAPPGACPYPLPETGCGEPAGFSATEHEMLVLANGDDDTLPELLELIEPVSEDGGVTGAARTVVRPQEDQCDIVRNLRDLPASHVYQFRNYTQRLTTGDFFSLHNVRYWASRIAWRGYPLDFSEITIDGSPWIDRDGNLIGTTGFPFAAGFGERPHGIPGETTGNAAWSGTSVPWPCASYPSYVDGDLGVGLFRTHAMSAPGIVGCNSQFGRAILNRRMGRAATTLAALAGVGLGELRLPAYYGIDVTMPSRSDEVTDYEGRAWRVAGSGQVGTHTVSGLLFAPLASDAFRVWTGHVDTFGTDTGSMWPISTTRPMAFLNFGHAVTGGDTERANLIAQTLWEGMQGREFDASGGVARASGFFGGEFLDSTVIVGLEPFEARRSGFGRDHHTNNLFVRSLLRSDAPGREYLNNKRNSIGQTNFQHLTGLFSQPAFDFDNTNENVAHLFANDDLISTTPGAGITRGDLLDAMELMCQVAGSLPDADVPPPAPTQPVIYTMADVGSVRIYVERLADRIDQIARRQVVQDVPLDVVRDIRGESSSIDPGGGTYGDAIERLKEQLRLQAAAPRDIAGAMRGVSTALDIMQRNQHIFDNLVATTVLRSIVNGLAAAASCLSSTSGSAGGLVVGGALCGMNAAIAVLETAIDGIALDSAAHEHQNEFDQFVDGILGNFDLIEGKQAEMLNATSEVRRILNELRGHRVAAQSALAGALFASSDATGRYYHVNTAMRRVYDINLQRYRGAHQAAVRTAVVARMAIEQRFGVNLEEQTCTSLVEPPSLWAHDVCNATGINYGQLRGSDPTADFGEDAIRRLFIGDYVRRLEHFTESYRFDAPYTSGDDLMVISLREDVVQARGPCTEEAENLLGASNDLTAEVLPNAWGEFESEAVSGWHVPSGGCAGTGVNCVRVRPVDGPRVATVLGPPGPVPGRIAGQPPHGFEVTFAPGAPAGTTDYTDAAALVQSVVLPGGVYRLSWYELSGSATQVDMRTAVEAMSSTAMYLAQERPMAAGWARRFRFIEVPATPEGTLYYVGVFPQPMGTMVQERSATIAGMQLENVSGTGAAEAAADAAVDPERHGPPLFAATTAAGWARYEDCQTNDPRAFRSQWSRRCAELCSGGFGAERCLPGEDPQTRCYWELVFNIDEERLLGRGRQFGGGFAFGNFNYRSGDVAVNLVGTGVRDCESGGSACYSTAGLPFSLWHGPSGHDGDRSAYTVRSHTGELFPVHLFLGRVEGGRALAAERYLTNPLSSSDAALLSSYERGELRGRPMTGNYRILLWDVPDLAFHNIEDVQLLWRYRYFTRTGDVRMCPPPGG